MSSTQQQSTPQQSTPQQSTPRQSRPRQFRQHQSTEVIAAPVVHARAVGAAALLGIGLTAAAGLLWVAAAFSSHDSWAYSHLAWWLGGSVIGASLLAGLAAGALSNARGPIAGAVNGATTGAILVAVTGGVALLALAVNGSLDQSLLAGHHDVAVNLVRPYVAFWAAAGSLVLGAAGGGAGGLLPRRPVSYPEMALAPVSDIRSASPVNGNAAGF